MEQSLLFFVYFKKVIPDLPVLSLSKDRASMSVFIHRYIGITSLLKVTDYVDSRLRGNDRLFVMSGKRQRIETSFSSFKRKIFPLRSGWTCLILFCLIYRDSTYLRCWNDMPFLNCVRHWLVILDRKVEDPVGYANRLNEGVIDCHPGLDPGSSVF